jgi:hypothetical protein
LRSADLRFRHRLAAFDQRLAVFLSLGDDPLGLGRSPLDHRRSFAVGCRGLGLIFPLQLFRLLAQRLGFVELVADRRDLLVERLADRRRHFLPDRQGEHQQHGDCDPAARTEAERGRLMLGAARCLGVRDGRAMFDISH